MLPKLSCAISGISKTESVFDAVKAVKEAGFDGVDFALSRYAKKDGPLTREDQWLDWVREVKAYLEQLSLESAGTPTNPSPTFDAMGRYCTWSSMWNRWSPRQS